MALVSRKTRALRGALADFYGPGLGANTYVARVFALTSRLLRSSLYSHGVLDRKNGSLEANFDHAPPGLAEAFGAFGRVMSKYAPFRFDPTVNNGKPFSALDFYSQTAFRDLDIYQEVYRPMRFVDHCFVNIPADHDNIVFVGFMRDSRPFDSEEKQLLAELQPHLAHGRQLALAITAAEDTPTAPELFCRAGFTPRESDVLTWLTRGKSNEEISSILGLRADSVSRHLQSIYAKVGVEHRVAAMLHAVRLAQRLHAEADVLESGPIHLSVSCAKRVETSKNKPPHRLRRA